MLVNKFMKLTNKQLIAFAEALVFANGLRVMARKKAKVGGPLNATIDVPLTRSFFRRHNCKCRDAILLAFDFFFERVVRGNSAYQGNTARVSTWRLRMFYQKADPLFGVEGRWVEGTAIELGAKEMATLKELYEANKEHIASVHQEVFRTDTKTVVQTTFEFPTPELRTVFEQQFLNDAKESEMKQGSTHTPETIKKMQESTAGKAKTPEHRAAIAAAQKARWQRIKEAMAQHEQGAK